MFLRFIILISLATAALYWCFIQTQPQDQETYTKLMQESIEMRTHNPIANQPAHQKRLGVRKEIWTQDETSHFMIESEHSDLTLSQKKEKTEAIEKLENILCTLPDEITLKADIGILEHPSEQLIAKNNCHLTHGENYIDGDQIQLDLKQEIVTYQNPKGRLASGPLHFTAETLIWYKKENKIYLNNNVIIEQPGQFTLHGDQGLLTLDAFEPELLTLTGHVHLISSQIQNKESYAVAESLTYNPKEKTLLFSSERKVLFWQEGLSLSATEVLIREDQTVEGKGEVHFSFDLEEQNFINDFFNNYL